ncbi:hypothetical protein D3C81_1605610 [compost metagenome]
MGIFQQECRVQRRPTHHTGQVSIGHGQAQPFEQAGKRRIYPQRLGIRVDAMLVAPDAGKQRDPARAAQGRLLAGLAVDSASVGLAVIQPLFQVGGVAQQQVLLQLHTVQPDEQGFGAAGVSGRIATRQHCQKQH